MADQVFLQDLTVDAMVGVTEAEQRGLQPVVVDLELDVDLDGAAGGDLSASVDYAVLHQAVAFLAQHGQWRLIETFATAVARLVLAPPPPAGPRAVVEAVRVRVRKPTILDGAVPGVQLHRTADWCDLSTRMVPEKTWLDTLVETERSGAYRAHVEPDSVFELPPGVAALVTAGRVDAGGLMLRTGDRLARGEVTRVKARGSKPATLLVVGQPPFVASPT